MLETILTPDLILMDTGLVGSLDGVETARQIRQHYDIPILFLTAHSKRTNIDEAKSIPSCAYVGKPYLEKDLLAAIENCLRK